MIAEPHATVDVESGDLRYRLVVCTSDPIGETIARTGQPYEERLLRWLRRIVGDRDGAFIDVGANIGNHAIFFAIAGRPVIAIEPNPASVAFIGENTRINGVRMDVWPVAAGAHDGRGNVVLVAQGDLGMARFDEDPNGSIEMRSLDSIDTTAAIVKIDVEGHETDVLDGAMLLLQRDRPLLVIEVWDKEHRHQVHTRIRPLGYKRIPVSLCDTPTYLWAVDRRTWLRALVAPEVVRHVIRRAAGRTRVISRRIFGRVSADNSRDVATHQVAGASHRVSGPLS